MFLLSNSKFRNIIEIDQFENEHIKVTKIKIFS